MKRTVSRLIAITVLLAAAAAAKNPPVRGMIVQSDWLAQHLNDKNIVVLHVGVDRKSYEQGHIPGARFLPLASIAVTRNGVPNEMPAVAELTQAFERAGVGSNHCFGRFRDRHQRGIDVRRDAGRPAQLAKIADESIGDIHRRRSMSAHGFGQRYDLPLPLALDDQPQRDGLHATCGDSLLYSLPENRARLVSDEAIENALDNSQKAVDRIQAKGTHPGGRPSSLPGQPR